MAEEFLFLTELLGLQVFDLKRRAIGAVKDAAIVPLVHPSRVDRFLIGGSGGTWFSIRHDQIRSISLRGIQLRDENLTPYHSDEYMLRLVRDLLDQQIIDVDGRKVVRVTDITFLIQPTGDAAQADGGEVMNLHDIDIGLRSIFRRLMQGLLPRKLVRSIQEYIPPNSIRWEFCNIVEHDPQRRLRLNITDRLLEKLHPADLADIVEELGPEDREAIFASIPSDVAAEALSEVDPDIQASILEALDAETAADIVEEMAPDQAADVLGEIDEKASEGILEEMEAEEGEEIRELLEFEDDTAGGLMNTEYLAVPETATVGEAIAAMRNDKEIIDTLNTLFLIDPEERPQAAIPLARLFLHDPATPLRDLVEEDEPLIDVDVFEKQDRVAELFDKYNLLALPVVNDKKQLFGVITADDIISVLRDR